MPVENISRSSLKRVLVVSLIGGPAALALTVLAPAWAQVGPRNAAVQIHVDRSIAYYNSGNLPRAIAELSKAHRLLPNDADINFMLGNALYRHGDMRAAADAYERSLAVRPNYFEAHMSRGFALFDLREFQEAVAEWLAAVRLDPKEPFAQAALAVGLYSIGQPENARVRYREAVTLDRRYADPESLRIDIRWTPKALTIVKQLLELSCTEKAPGSP